MVAKFKKIDILKEYRGLELKKALSINYIRVAIISVLIVAIGIILYFYISYDIKNDALRSEISMIEGLIHSEEMQRQLDRVDSLESEMLQLETRVLFLKEKAGLFRSLPLLNDDIINTVLNEKPGGVTILAYNYTVTDNVGSVIYPYYGGLTISCVCEDDSLPSRFADALMKTDKFSNVNYVGYTATDGRTNFSVWLTITNGESISFGETEPSDELEQKG